MSKAQPPSLQEVQSALDDVQRIRDLLDSSHRDHPLRRIFRPLTLLGFFFGPLVIGFGIWMQWVYGSGRAEILGFDRTTVLWLLGGSAMLLTGVAKLVIFRFGAVREGFGLAGFFRRVYSLGYLRILVAIASVVGVSCVVVAELGRPDMIVGLITLGFGALLIALPVVLPLPETSSLGVFFLVGGALAVFLLPAYPFYKVAALWGVGFGVIMPLGHWALAGPGASDVEPMEAGLDSDTVRD